MTLHQPDVSPSRSRNPHSPAEIARIMPAGARGWVRQHITHRTPFEEFPGLILKWLTRHGVVKPSRKPGQDGRLVATRTGQKVITQIKNRMEGRQ